MVSTVPIVPQPLPQPIGEQRVVFRHLNWLRYQAIRHALSERRNTRSPIPREL